MRKLLVALAVGLPVAAWAHNCPNEMKAIDAKLARAVGGVETLKGS